MIALNLGENNIKFVSAQNINGKIDIDLIGQYEDTPSFFELETDKIFEEELKIFKKIYDNVRVNKKNVNIVIPDGYTYSQIVYMPRLKEKELLSAIKYQADQFIPMPIEETTLDLEIIYENKSLNKLLVLIVASPQKLIEKVQKLVELSGFFPESIENELSATARFLTNFYKPPTQDGGTIFVNLGYSYTSFYYFDHKLKLLVDSHNFQAGFSVFLREAQADINIDIDKAKNLLQKVGFLNDSSINLDQVVKPAVDALSVELEKFINSLKIKFQVSNINRLYFFNYAAKINLLDKKIGKLLSIPAARLDPQAITNKNSVVMPFLKDLSAYIATCGGSLT